jgi:hypothetical protein
MVPNPAGLSHNPSGQNAIFKAKLRLWALVSDESGPICILERTSVSYRTITIRIAKVKCI